MARNTAQILPLNNTSEANMSKNPCRKKRYQKTDLKESLIDFNRLFIVRIRTFGIDLGIFEFVSLY